MEKLNRDLQQHLLHRLADVYPDLRSPKDLGFDMTDSAINVNLLYLQEHGLVEARTTQTLDDYGPKVVAARITAHGMDFLMADGGLAAILGVVTVRFAAETLRALLETKVDESDAKPEEKSALKKKLTEMGSDALKEVMKRLIDVGFKHGPEALGALQAMVP